QRHPRSCAAPQTTAGQARQVLRMLQPASQRSTAGSAFCVLLRMKRALMRVSIRQIVQEKRVPDVAKQIYGGLTDWLLGVRSAYAIQGEFDEYVGKHSVVYFWRFYSGADLVVCRTCSLYHNYWYSLGQSLFCSGQVLVFPFWQGCRAQK